MLIGELISKGVEPPTQLIEDFLYEGRVHAVVSEAGTGKTLLALWAALEVMKEGGSVLYLDEENGGRLIGERLLNMGADLEMLDRSFFYHHSPGITLKANALAELRVTAEAVRPALVVFDSLPDFLALAGLNENEAADVTRWFLEVARPLRDAGSAVLLLDHVVKSAEGRGRYARGSGAKLAKVDASWSLAQTAPFDRESVGEITLTRQKDREACLPKAVTFAAGGTERGLVFRRCAGIVEEPGEDGLTGNQLAALDALEPHPDGLTWAAWTSASGLPETSFKRARKDLLNCGRVEQIGKRYRKVEPEVEGPRATPVGRRPVAPDSGGHAAPLEDG